MVVAIVVVVVVVVATEVTHFVGGGGRGAGVVVDVATVQVACGGHISHMHWLLRLGLELRLREALHHRRLGPAVRARTVEVDFRIEVVVATSIAGAGVAEEASTANAGGNGRPVATVSLHLTLPGDRDCLGTSNTLGSRDNSHNGVSPGIAHVVEEDGRAELAPAAGLEVDGGGATDGGGAIILAHVATIGADRPVHRIHELGKTREAKGGPHSPRRGRRSSCRRTSCRRGVEELRSGHAGGGLASTGV
mmetsp:Transcript_3265/g.7259  ORF Transcript_3265/g.7259 Transcript_3265/m.7259 type:complete len:249 (-) Transcript_3265:399-1145(-)